MAELDDDAAGDPSGFEPLEESDDIRRIKEEWTRYQKEVGGIHTLKEAEELRVEIQTETEEANRRRTEAHCGKALPARLPSLEDMIGKVPSIPSMEIATGIGKKLPELTSPRHRARGLADPNDLDPGAVKLEKTTYNFGVDTPTQTDIKWSPPDNIANFNVLTYQIEVDGGQGWSPLTNSRLPILRVYFSSSKILVARYSRVQEAEPVAVRLRVKAVGTVKHQSQEQTVDGPWSEEIWLSLEGTVITGNTSM